MKITLEINTANEQDLMDAIISLKSLIPEKNVFIEGATYTTEKVVESCEDVNPAINFDVLGEIELVNTDEEKARMESEINDFKNEIINLKEVIENLKKEKLDLKKEKESLSNKVLNLEAELNSVPDVPDFNDGVSSENAVSKEVVEDYKKKIEFLTKEVAFHEGRSNKNFDEVKKLRNVVDNISAEKRSFEKKVVLLEKELDEIKSNSAESLSEVNNDKISELENKVSQLENNKEKLLKEIDFQKNRNKNNWDEIKSLKHTVESLESEKSGLELKIKELSTNADNLNNKEDIDKLKIELVQLKSEYEGIISELRVTNDKIQNEINLYKTKYSEEMIDEYNHLKTMKKAICSYDKGASFWSNVEANIAKL